MITRVGYDICDGLGLVRHLVVCEGRSHPENAKFDQSWDVTRGCGCDQLTRFGCVGVKTWKKVPQVPVSHRIHLHRELVVGYFDSRLRSGKNI